MIGEEGKAQVLRSVQLDLAADLIGHAERIKMCGDGLQHEADIGTEARIIDLVGAQRCRGDDQHGIGIIRRSREHTGARQDILVCLADQGRHRLDLTEPDATLQAAGGRIHSPAAERCDDLLGAFEIEEPHRGIDSMLGVARERPITLLDRRAIPLDPFDRGAQKVRSPGAIGRGRNGRGVLKHRAIGIVGKPPDAILGKLLVMAPLQQKCPLQFGRLHACRKALRDDIQLIEGLSRFAIGPEKCRVENRSEIRIEVTRGLKRAGMLRIDMDKDFLQEKPHRIGARPVVFRKRREDHRRLAVIPLQAGNIEPAIANPLTLRPHRQDACEAGEDRQQRADRAEMLLAFDQVLDEFRHAVGEIVHGAVVHPRKG